MSGSYFRKGESTFKCESCGRMTRRTNVQSVGAMVCPQCYELAGIENEISDGYKTAAEVRKEVMYLAEEIREKGGTPRIDFLDEKDVNARQTNTELLTELMENAQSGPLMQAFIIQAIEQFAEGVAAAPISELESPMVSADAWLACAVEARDKIKEHLRG